MLGEPMYMQLASLVGKFYNIAYIYLGNSDHKTNLTRNYTE